MWHPWRGRRCGPFLRMGGFGATSSPTPPRGLSGTPSTCCGRAPLARASGRPPPSSTLWLMQLLVWRPLGVQWLPFLMRSRRRVLRLLKLLIAALGLDVLLVARCVGLLYSMHRCCGSSLSGWVSSLASGAPPSPPSAGPRCVRCSPDARARGLGRCSEAGRADG
ncbi:unnamed protein product [Prorocentrum cordatum]|uniref:Uncharacterized protein n=1 Tax=Prorocentrum cordatum TaxID=2364126 RepID=A0ABN9S9M6_9DINO|nr:unnamed protein product [Polarella glacialis]